MEQLTKKRSLTGSQEIAIVQRGTQSERGPGADLVGCIPAANLTRGEDTDQRGFSHAVRQGQVRGVLGLGNETEGHANIGRQKLCSRLSWGNAQLTSPGRDS